MMAVRNFWLLLKRKVKLTVMAVFMDVVKSVQIGVSGKTPRHFMLLSEYVRGDHAVFRW